MPASINPIIPGFAPDPSIVKVDDWFFLVNSSFHLFPGLPIFASQDLLSWKQIGNAINRPTQLSLKVSDTQLHPQKDTGDVLVATGGLYAPTIRHHNGTFYIVCTNVIRTPQGDNGVNFIISTRDIWSDEWSDPVYFEFKGIDPSILFDDDGRTYIHGSAAPGPYTTINLFEVDLQTGAKLSDERTIWRGTGGIYPEGPHLYKRNGWYYVLIAEGGTHGGHIVTMARSRDIWGPYEECPQNPILTARDTDEYIQYTGHADLFRDGEGQWWCVCLGVRRDQRGRFIMGRETFLTRGNWDGDWPVLDQVKSTPNGMSDAESSKLAVMPGLDYVRIRDVVQENYHIDDAAGSITMKASPVDLSDPQLSPSFVGKRQRLLDGSSSVTVQGIDTKWTPARAQAGLVCYKDEHRYLRIFFDADTLAIVVELVNKAKEVVQREQHELGSLPERVSFRMEYTEQEYRLLYSLEKGNMAIWKCVSVVDTLELTGPDFTGPVIGVYAVAQTDDMPAEFRDLNIE
ncbi:putative xylosidase/arabinosidase [Aspergillus clavatus NRRL 1]|uniref:Xylosidase/arabinosidase, putative n=1 Tax=Aspergillus clavatus (strain ATCC 1007 / CBS 513.65 / DSM 816 / NCTC 3887 / NRRL 1 / QM 1276 / 107) TaxID=344612 RepID=A1CUS5_ASPCL|nr:xylosidase/arabinosidase, putative [Aspergillus clavatus NRRL 1]EAW07062.1 xylosidase/arabinosidase, putative [Aspergillus clavatus NRRL 1]